MIITTLLEKMKQSLSEILHGSVDFKKIKIKKKLKKLLCIIIFLDYKRVLLLLNGFGQQD
jgi:hypothetical protein